MMIQQDIRHTRAQFQNPEPPAEHFKRPNKQVRNRVLLARTARAVLHFSQQARAQPIAPSSVTGKDSNSISASAACVKSTVLKQIENHSNPQWSKHLQLEASMLNVHPSNAEQLLREETYLALFCLSSSDS